MDLAEDRAHALFHHARHLGAYIKSNRLTAMTIIPAIKA